MIFLTSGPVSQKLAQWWCKARSMSPVCLGIYELMVNNLKNYTWLKIRRVFATISQCWFNVGPPTATPGPTWNQHWFSVSRYLWTLILLGWRVVSLLPQFRRRSTWMVSASWVFCILTTKMTWAIWWRRWGNLCSMCFQYLPGSHWAAD